MARTYLENECASMGGYTPDQIDPVELERLKEHMRTVRGIDPDAYPSVDECFTCSICGEKIENEWSHNAEPVNSGRCCIMCNYKVVLPARLKNMGW